MKIRIAIISFCIFLLFSNTYTPIVNAASPEKALKCTINFLKQPLKDEPIFGGVSLNGYDFYNYKFQKGDLIEYEVYLETKIAGIGYLDVQNSKIVSVDADNYETHDWCFLRPGKEHPDQPQILDESGMNYDRNIDLAGVAYKKWYKRVVKIPDFIASGYSSRHWAVYAFASLDLATSGSVNPAIVYYRNIKVIGQEGETKKVIFDDNEKFISAELFDINGIKIDVEETTDFPGSKSIASENDNSFNSSSSKNSNNSSNSNITDNSNGNKSFIYIVIIAIVGLLGLVLGAFFLIKKYRKVNL